MSAKWRARTFLRGGIALASALLALCLTVSNTQAQTPETIGYGQTVNGEVVDRLGAAWIFNGCADDVVTISMQSADFSAYLELYGPTDRDSLVTAVAEGPGATAAIQDFTLSTAGGHVIVAAGGSILDRGAYTLSLQATAVAEQETTGHLADGVSVQGSVDNRLGQEWSIHGCAGDVIAITMESTEFTPLLAVIGPDGAGVIEADGVDNTATVENLSLPINGNYTIIAAGSSILDRGAYTLTYRLVERPTPVEDSSESDSAEVSDSASAPATPVPPGSSSAVETKGGDASQPLCIVVGEMVNLYTGPDTAYELLGGLEQGAEVIPRNRNADQSWIRVQVAGEGIAGWIQATPELLSCNVDIIYLPLGIIPPLYTPTPVPYPTDCYTPTPTYTPTEVYYTPTYTPTPTEVFYTPTYTPTPTEVYYTPTYTPTPTEVYYTPTYTPTPTEVYYTPTYTPTPTEVYYTPTYTPTPTEVYYTPTYTPTPTEVYYTPTYTPTPTEVYYTPTPTPTEPYGGGYEPVGHRVYPPTEHYGDLEGAIYVPENYGQDYEPVFYNYLYIEAYVYDPYAGYYDGAGIDYVDFTVYDEHGDQVYYKREVTARYCLFGGGEPVCPALVIQPGIYWPGTNHPLTEGRYKVRIDAHPGYNNSDPAYWEFYFWIQPQYDNGGGNGNDVGLYGEIVQTGHGHNNDEIEGRMTYQVEAYYPGEGNYDGAGIDYVVLQIYYDGDKVYEKQENSAGYCAFGGGEPNCTYWDFSDHDYEWPGGKQIVDGWYLLRAIIHADNGMEKTIERQVMISP